jgi:hypothetical protein
MSPLEHLQALVATSKDQRLEICPQDPTPIYELDDRELEQVSAGKDRVFIIHGHH